MKFSFSYDQFDLSACNEGYLRGSLKIRLKVEWKGEILINRKIIDRVILRLVFRKLWNEILKHQQRGEIQKHTKIDMEILKNSFPLL